MQEGCCIVHTTPRKAVDILFHSKTLSYEAKKEGLGFPAFFLGLTVFTKKNLKWCHTIGSLIC